MTDTGASMAAARMRCPTPFVRNSPPWPYIRSIRTFSSFSRMFSPSFSTLKALLQRLEAAMPGRKLDFYQGFLARARPVFARREAEEGVELAPCTSCGYPTSSGDMCGVCRIREALKDSK